MAILTICLLVSYLRLSVADNTEEATYTTTQIIEQHGYPAEEHKVVTRDGYILTVNRIPYGRNSDPILTQQQPSLRPVVFLQHCLLCNSAIYVLSGPEKGLGFLLADRGYDVWMGNARGSRYSQEHVSLSTNDSAFWKFSWDEIGLVDLPAMLDHVLLKTGQPSLFYVGHSMGTTSLFALLSARPEYNAKIRHFTGLAPATTLSHIRSSLMRFMVLHISPLLEERGSQEMIPLVDRIMKAVWPVCIPPFALNRLCINGYFMMSGFNEEQFDKKLIPSLFGHIPSGSSARTFAHYGQNIKSGIFRRYDHGAKLNWLYYNSSAPPEYDLRNFQVPTSLFYGENDLLVGPKAIDRLRASLPPVHTTFKVPHKLFGHLDFLFATDVVPLLYNKVIEQIEMYTQFEPEVVQSITGPDLNYINFQFVGK